jgi:hypothetical protein
LTQKRSFFPGFLTNKTGASAIKLLARIQPLFNRSVSVFFSTYSSSRDIPCKGPQRTSFFLLCSSFSKGIAWFLPGRYKGIAVPSSLSKHRSNPFDFLESFLRIFSLLLTGFLQSSLNSALLIFFMEIAIICVYSSFEALKILQTSSVFLR